MRTEQLLKHFHFVIGEQYEKYEFDLTTIEDITINGITYERYLYRNKELKKLFDIVPNRIILHFNVDILCAIHFIFNGNYYSFFNNQINEYLLLSNDKMSTSPFSCYDETYTELNNLIIQIKKKDDNNTYVSIENKTFYESIQVDYSSFD